MKLIDFTPFFSKQSKSKPKPKSKPKSKSKKSKSKKTESESTSFRSSSGDLTPQSVLPRHEISSIELPDLFALFDLDGDGKITRLELEIVLRKLNPDPPTADELASMVAEIDRDGDGCISLDELKKLETLTLTLGAPAGDNELRDAFDVFDVDRDGKISAEELLGVFRVIGEADCGIEDCRRMIGGVDSDGDGFVCFEDFVRMMEGQR